MSTRLKRNLQHGLSLIPLLLGLFSAPAMPDEVKERDGFVVRSASSELYNGVYRMDARIRYSLSSAALDALNSGVPLVIEMEIEIVRPRKWIWNETVATLNQRYRVAFHALTKQYVVTHLNTQVQHTHTNRINALNAMGVVENLPLIDKRLLKDDEKYQVRVRARLLINELPTPMRPWAYISGDWHLTSEWFTWALN